jgi:nucleoside-diphosphate-sugar epimerase
VEHLAAHYDFTGDEHPQYRRTNVDGLRHVLEACRTPRPKRFVLSSSAAACRLPPPGGALDEGSPPDGEHIYARTKRLGEQMVREYEQRFPATIVRFAALFSDWWEDLVLFFEHLLPRLPELAPGMWDRSSDGLQAEMREDITTMLQFGCDPAQDVFETLEAQGGGAGAASR